MGTRVPDVLRGRIIWLGGDLDVGEEGSEQEDRNPAILTALLHWLSIRTHTNKPCQEG